MAKSKPSTVEIEVRYDEGCWQAAGIHHGIFTTGQTLDELWANLCEAASLYFDVPAERLGGSLQSCFDPSFVILKPGRLKHAGADRH
jgi:predicted RNase H-like HicB family nuclease